MKIFLNLKNKLSVFVTSLFILSTSFAASSTNLSIMMSADGPEVELMENLISKYKSVDPSVNIEINLVGYNVIREQLPVQLEAGSGPDIGKITDLGGLNPYYVDLTPYVDAAEWNKQYGGVLPWYRAGKPDGIFGFHNEMTVTGPYVNLSMFEEAGVEVPSAGATWDDWADATRQVMENTGSYAGMVMDRSGHRMAGPAMSYGAKYFDSNGNMIVDDGFKTFAQKMVDWHAEGLMPADIWPAVSGSKYANGNEMFFNQDVPFYMSGSWNVTNVMNSVGDSFEWTKVPVPCGPAGCGIMPGGSGFVAFNHSPNAEAAAKFVAWLGEYEQAREWYTYRMAIPAHAQIQAEGIDYSEAGASEAVSNALNVFAADAARAAKETPQAYQLQGSKFGFVIYNATTQYLGGVMNGEYDLDTAIERIKSEIAEKTGQ